MASGDVHTITSRVRSSDPGDDRPVLSFRRRVPMSRVSSVAPDNGRPDGRIDDGVRRLGIAVLRQAIEDGQGTDVRAAQARAWLHGNSLVLQHWCACAGIGTPEALQRYLRRPKPAARPEWPPRRFDEEGEAA